jgi:hypothetical protein
MDEVNTELKKLIDDLLKKLEEAHEYIKFLEVELQNIKTLTNYHPH